MKNLYELEIPSSSLKSSIFERWETVDYGDDLKPLVEKAARLPKSRVVRTSIFGQRRVVFP